MARLKPTEVRLVADILAAPPVDTVEGLAEAIITALDEKRESVPQWVTIMHEPNVHELVPFGPYSTENQARKALGQLASAGPKPASAWVRKVRPIPDDTPSRTIRPKR